MWAHRERYRWYRPTELMTWEAMRRAVAAGCDTFDLMGGGEFKEKFGAALDHSKWRWVRGRSRWPMRARRVAVLGYRAQQAVRGRLSRAADSWAQRARDTAHRLLGRRPDAEVAGEAGDEPGAPKAAPEGAVGLATRATGGDR